MITVTVFAGRGIRLRSEITKQIRAFIYRPDVIAVQRDP
jgi:hypothetical protein